MIIYTHTIEHTQPADDLTGGGGDTLRETSRPRPFNWTESQSPHPEPRPRSAVNCTSSRGHSPELLIYPPCGRADKYPFFAIHQHAPQKIKYPLNGSYTPAPELQSLDDLTGGTSTPRGEGHKLFTAPRATAALKQLSRNCKYLFFLNICGRSSDTGSRARSAGRAAGAAPEKPEKQSHFYEAEKIGGAIFQRGGHLRTIFKKQARRADRKNCGTNFK